MSTSGLSPADEYLRNAAEKYFKKTYQHPPIRRSEAIKPLGWAPSLQIDIHDYRTVICEMSAEKPYPQMLALRGHDVMQVQAPICVFSVCPEEEFLKADQQKSVKDLVAHGFGLITVDSSGDAMVRHDCIPLVQRVPDAAFQTEIRGLPSKFRQKTAQCYENYKKNSVAGVQELSGLVEGIILQAGRDAIAKTWLTNGQAAPGKAADTLDNLFNCKQLQNIRAKVAAARGYIDAARNTVSHYPKNKKQAYKKFNDCRENFIQGLKITKDFREALRSAALSGDIPKV